MYRRISAYLEEWRSRANRKALLIRGARQVGKTYSVRELGRSFENYVEVNFLESKEVRQFFQLENISPKTIIQKLEIYYGCRIVAGKTLLFFDEIQECPDALASLRFFYEKMADLHVVATGSLIEFALQEIPSHGVGRVESLFMYPLSFEEFLYANNNPELVEVINRSDINSQIDNVIHTKIKEIFKIYTILGGLPEVIQTYINTGSVTSCLPVIDNLILGYEDDFYKFKSRISIEKLRDVFRATASQAGSKFIYSSINPESNISGYDTALKLLELAGLAYKIRRTSANGIPIGSEVDPKSFKVIPFDFGIYQRLLKLPISDLVLNDDIAVVNSGALGEVICGIELIAHSSPRMRSEQYYWNREVKGASSEVDYVCEKNGKVVPLEVKAGTKGQMQSIYVFMNAKRSDYGIRTSLENFTNFPTPDKQAQINVVPLYAIGSYMQRV